MKIAYAVVDFDPRDVTRGSGWPYFLTRELERQGHTVHTIGPLAISFALGTRVLRRLSRLLGWRYRSYQDLFTAPRIGAAVAAQLQPLDVDCLLTNDYAIAGYTPTDLPVIVYTDALFPRNYEDNINPRLANLSPWTVYSYRRITQRGLHRADLLAYPARYFVGMAADYGILRDAVHVIEWGANFEQPPDPALAASRSFATITAKGQIDLLFVGKDWQRKGGRVAVATAEALQQRGINAVLHVVGGDPPEPYDPAYIKVYGLLNKSDETDRRTLTRLFANSDAFILPSVAEGFGLVYAEAAAYGLPSLAYDTVGVASAVRDGVSGILLDLAQGAAAFADIVAGWYADPARYDRLTQSARAFYENTVNWPTAAARLMAAVEQTLPRME